MRFSLALAALVLFSACAHDRQYFRPTERVRGQTLQGYHEAFYELVGSQGRFGEAKVWSRGAYRQGDESVVEVALDVHNTSGQPIEISAKDLHLDPVRTRDAVLRKLPAAETGVFKVAPESRASLRAHFLLPDGMHPGSVTSLGFSWRVKNGAQSYAQVTPFREEAAYYPPYERGYIYYNPVYACSPYDLHCVGFYDDWPHQHHHPGDVPPPHQHEERRRVHVGD